MTATIEYLTLNKIPAEHRLRPAGQGESLVASPPDDSIGVLKGARKSARAVGAVRGPEEMDD